MKGIKGIQRTTVPSIFPLNGAKNLDKLATLFKSTAIFCLFKSVFAYLEQGKHSSSRLG